MPHIFRPFTAFISAVFLSGLMMFYFSGTADAAPRVTGKIVSSKKVVLPQARGKNNVQALQVQVDIINNSNDEKVITKIYDCTVTISGQIYVGENRVRKFSDVTKLGEIRDLDLWPGKSITKSINMYYYELLDGYTKSPDEIQRVFKNETYKLTDVKVDCKYVTVTP